MMLVYTENTTPRLQYIVETLLKKHFIQLQFTKSSETFYSFNGPKLNYSHKKFSTAEFHIQPSGLLFQQGIQKQNITCFGWNGMKAFFKTHGDIPFDIFSAAFYLLSRYEEYLPHNKDSYGRFAHTESIAFREDFLNFPLVNLWVEELLKLLKNKFSTLNFQYSMYNFIPTYDIDIAYAYQGKGFARNAAVMLKALLKGDMRKVKEITPVLFNKQKDPFDVYDWLHELHTKHQLQPIYFFLVAMHRSMYDKNLSPTSAALQLLIKKLSSNNTVGLHPSWQSCTDERLLLKEKKLLQEISRIEVTRSRQHYIQFTLPKTFRALIEAGITDDYSMGYGSINGFRASYANSFYWYDLMKEEQTTLMLHPFCYMEANCYFEQKLTAEQAAEELQHYYNIVKQVNGELITIFHNHFLAAEEQWQPWKSMYAEFLHRNFS